MTESAPYEFLGWPVYVIEERRKGYTARYQAGCRECSWSPAPYTSALAARNACQGHLRYEHPPEPADFTFAPF